MGNLWIQTNSIKVFQVNAAFVFGVRGKQSGKFGNAMSFKLLRSLPITVVSDFSGCIIIKKRERKEHPERKGSHFPCGVAG